MRLAGPARPTKGHAWSAGRDDTVSDRQILGQCWSGASTVRTITNSAPLLTSYDSEVAQFEKFRYRVLDTGVGVLDDAPSAWTGLSLRERR